MSTEQELRDRVEELEQRIEQLEESIPATETTTVGGNESVPEIDTNQQSPMDVITEVVGAEREGARLEDIHRALEQEGFDHPQDQVKDLKQRGAIYEPHQDLVRVV